MNPLLLGTLIDVGKELLDRLFPDKVRQAEQRAQAERELREWALKAEQYVTEKLEVSDRNQIEVNKIEAASSDWVKSRWRPAAGWVCVTGFAYQYVAWPFLVWGSQNFGWVAPPQLDVGELMVILGGMLGLGVYRSFEKKHGVA